MKELGKRLRELRIKNDLSQDDVARALGVTAQAVSKWENGRSDPEISNLIPISDFFHIPVDELLEKGKHHEEWEKEWLNVLESDDKTKIITFLKSALAEFPGDYKFRYRLASEEFFLAQDETDGIKRMRLLAQADDHLESLRKDYPEFSNAIDMHVRVLAALGRKDEAVDLAKLSANHERLLLSILEGEELTKQKRKLITLSLLNLFADLMREGSKEALKKAEVLLVAVSGNEPQFSSQLIDVYFQQALLCCEEGNSGAAIEALKTGMLMIQDYHEGAPARNESVFYPVMPKISQNTLRIQFDSYLHDDRFSSLRGITEYEELCENIKKSGEL